MDEPKAAPSPAPPVRRQIVDKIATLLTSAFGLVAALAWNDAVRALFDTYYPRGEGAHLTAIFLYASVVTVVAVVVTLWIGRLAQKVEDLEVRILARTRRAEGRSRGDDAVA